jgi:hypothetical protein
MDAVLGVRIVYNCCQKDIAIWTWHEQSSSVGFCGLKYKDDVTTLNVTCLLSMCSCIVAPVCFITGNSYC